MAYDYAIVHLKFTIPLAALLTCLSYPFLNKVHSIQVGVLIVVAFTATLPWDAYLIKTGVWTYPPEVIIGPRWLGIPVEELFFFVIQTYITSLIYFLLNKPLLHAKYLKSQRNPPAWISWTKLAGQIFLASITAFGAYLVALGHEHTYMGLILVWASPFALITWTMAGQFIISLPAVATVLPIILPTVYLWLVDELALGKGTWSIESGTKLEYRLFGTLEIEEATFFLVTNTLIVFGMATFDQYLAIIYTFPRLFADVRNPSPHLLLQGRFTSKEKYDMDRVDGIAEAVDRLRAKSRSFYLASAAFSGGMRIDLILLYSFCRMADDLVDHAASEDEIITWVSKLQRYLDFYYIRGSDGEPARSRPKSEVDQEKIRHFVTREFPPSARSALNLLPTEILPGQPLYDLIDGFNMDAQFSPAASGPKQFPINNQEDLRRYGAHVAGTVGELCVALIIHHSGDLSVSAPRRAELEQASRTMGTALQYVNIARDVAADAAIGRVYLPTTWLVAENLSPEVLLAKPEGPAVERLRRRLLDEAFKLYASARPAMGRIPAEGRAPMCVAVENYMEIGRVLREKEAWTAGRGRATVPFVRRLGVTLKTLVNA